MRIGIAGLGKMGAAMAARLQEAGAEIVVWNRSPGKAAPFGLQEAASPRELSERCDVVISSLFDAAAVTAVYAGPDGLLAAASGKLYIEMSTVRPQDQQALAGQVKLAGGAFIECPVGGTTGPARAGQLLGLAGGEAADVQRALPVLQLLCRRIEHIGPVGTGATAKLAINLPLLAFWQSFGEAMALMAPLGKSPEWLVGLFGETAGAANVLKVKAASVAAALSGQDAVEATFDIDTMRKDLRMMLDEAQLQGIALPVAGTVLSCFDDATKAGWGRRDCAWVPAFRVTQANNLERRWPSS